MTFIKKIKNREGRIYYYLGNSYRKDRTIHFQKIKYIGRDDQLKKEHDDIDQYCKMILDDYNKTVQESVDVSKVINTLSYRDNTFQNNGYHILESIYKSLNITSILDKYSKDKKFTYSLDEVMKLLVFGRCLEPKSKSKTVEEFQKTLFGNWNVKQNDMDRSLDHFDKVKEDVQLALHKSISKNIGREATLVFYDVTNYYFETDIVDDFRKRGYSKENRKSPIVQMGLFMDMNGIPIAYKLFEGNCTDPKTYMPAVEQVKKQFGIKRIVTVADKAMNSTKNVIDAISRGDGYLFSSKFRGVKGSRKDLQEFVLDNNNWQYNNDMTFAKKSTIMKRKLTNGKMIEEKVLATWNKKYAIREKIRRDGAIDYVNSLIPSQTKRILIGKHETKYYDVLVQDVNGNNIKLNPHIYINKEKVEFDELFDGMNVITTSELNMSDSEIIAAYGQLNRIEDCFRITKTDLRSRPVFVWTKEHIEAHFLTCFIALVIVKVLHYKLGSEFSVKRIIEALKSMNVRYFADNYYETTANKDAIKILEFFNINWSKELQTKRSIKSIAKVEVIHCD